MAEETLLTIDTKAPTTGKLKCTLARRAHFSAAVRSPKGEISGHNYVLEAFVSGPLNNSSGMIIGIKELSAILDKTVKVLDHKFINEDVEHFKNLPLSLEALTQFCFLKVNSDLSLLSGLKLEKIRLFETEDYWVEISC